MISAQDIENNGFEWQMIDQIRIGKVPVIVNTDTSAGPGVHWIVAVILPNGVPYVYDPLGPRNKRMTSNYQNSDVILMKALGNRIAMYPYPSQMRDNSLCGWHSLFIANTLKNGLKMGLIKNQKDADALIQAYFGKSADRADIEVLRRAFQ